MHKQRIPKVDELLKGFENVCSVVTFLISFHVTENWSGLAVGVQVHASTCTPGPAGFCFQEREKFAKAKQRLCKIVTQN